MLEALITGQQKNKANYIGSNSFLILVIVWFIALNVAVILEEIIKGDKAENKWRDKIVVQKDDGL